MVAEHYQEDDVPLHGGVPYCCGDAHLPIPVDRTLALNVLYAYAARKIDPGPIYSIRSWDFWGVRPRDRTSALSQLEEAGFCEVLGDGEFRILDDESEDSSDK